MNQLNESMNDSIHEFSNLDVSEEESTAAAREEQRQLQQSQLESEVSMLREKLAADSQRWSEKEQEYLSEISAVRSIQSPTSTSVSTVAAAPAVGAAVSVAPVMNVSFFVKSSIAIASALFVILNNN